VSAGFACQIAEIEAGRRAPVIRVGNLEARRDLTDVRDTVRAYDSILERGVAERPYNVCSNRPVAIQDVLDALLARASVAIEVQIDPARYRPNDTPLVLGDHQRITDELGWVPAIPFEQTVADLLDYWRHRIGRA
jgi:GDP-4-dehydro-6-deoxy-D-mannose reductase